MLTSCIITTWKYFPAIVHHLMWTKPKGVESNWNTLIAMRFSQQRNNYQSGNEFFFLLIPWVSENGMETGLYCLSHILLRGRKTDLMTRFTYFLVLTLWEGCNCLTDFV